MVISAPSGAGKTTLIRRLLGSDARFAFSISTTTRTPRPGERDGESYRFVDERRFLAMIDEGHFAEWARVHDRYYGTTKKEIDRIRSAGKIPIFDVDVQGARNLKNGPVEAVYIFIVPPSRRELEARLRNRRSESEEQIQLRLRNAMAELEAYGEYDYIVVNDDVDEAMERIRSIVTAEFCRTGRVGRLIQGILEENRDNPPE